MEGTLGTLYDINKQVIKNYKPLSKNKIGKIMNQMQEWIKEQNNEYYMLLCKEKSDYTVFRHVHKYLPYSLSKEIIEIAEERGAIVSIEQDKLTNAIEFWIKIDDEVFMYLLFGYDFGVVEVGV